MLGQGGTAGVYLGRFDGSECAVKVLLLDSIAEADALSECLMGILAVHPNICRIYGHFT